MTPAEALTSPLPLVIEHPDGSPPGQPVTVGVPLPRGRLIDPQTARLIDAHGQPVPLQPEALARWPDGSVKWLLLDFLTGALPSGRSSWQVHFDPAPAPSSAATLRIRNRPAMLEVNTGAAVFLIDRDRLHPLTQVRRGDQDLLSGHARLLLTDAQGGIGIPRIDQLEIEASGPIRATICLRGAFDGSVPCRFVARLDFFVGSSLVRLRLTVHNPNRAKHAGGLWDLGDPGSMLFRDLSLELPLRVSASSHLSWRVEPEEPIERVDAVMLEIYQDSSGGENWNSRNHVNREGRVPVVFPGYRLRARDRMHGGQPGCDVQRSGRRASPVVRIEGVKAAITASIPEFWQQFPKAIDVKEGRLSLRLFPRQFADLHELQGGEQKTHTLWLAFEGGDEDRPAHHNASQPPQESPSARHNSPLPPQENPSARQEVSEEDHSPGDAHSEATSLPLDWSHHPVTAHATPDWVAATGAIFTVLAQENSAEGRPSLPHDGSPDATPLEPLLQEMLEGPQRYVARREIIDEYGWRNYGEIYADHEGAYYKGPPPVVSHYNNQYDFLNGLIVDYLRSGDPRWLELLDPLARHVIDIDVYRTQRDKAAYNGGLFWHTDHYLDAASCSHRTFSAANINGRKGYGGGPGAQHNATTGLMHYYYLTGDRQARDTALVLADWVVAMEDGSRNILGVLVDDPTGWATSTFNFHGPGRGAGYSITALLDAWLLTGQPDYLTLAETLIRRAVHPSDDVGAQDLLNAELRWSYTIFLTALGRYLHLKAEAGQIDFMYAWAQASLVRYASWMLEHESPYFDRIETLEYPTETWAGQEMRKANVLRLAAAHVDEPLRGALLKRGLELADRAWQDLMRFESRSVARSMAIFMVDGPRDDYFRRKVLEPAPRPGRTFDFGVPQPFAGQRAQVVAKLKSGPGLARAVGRLVEVGRWRRLWAQEASIKP